MSKAEKKINGVLRVLTALLELGEATAVELQKKARISNYYTLRTYIEALKEVEFIEEEYSSGPPAKYIIKLTEKGKQAAEYAKAILELAKISIG